jgi:hypothetical protein
MLTSQNTKRFDFTSDFLRQEINKRIPKLFGRMRCFSFPCFARWWVAGTVLASFASRGAHAEEEVIWSGADRLEVNEMLEAQNGNCRLFVYGDGNFLVRRRIPGLDDASDEWPTSWSTDRDQVHAYYALELTHDGNLELYNEDDYEIVWTTNVVGDVSSDGTLHELVIDGACRLKLQWDGVDVWENIKIPPFKAGQVLQRGDMFRMSISIGQVPFISHPFRLQYVLLLQHDCNLVQYVGTDNADRGAVVWKTETPRPMVDCYLYLDKARVTLYEGTFDNTLGFGAARMGEYWSTPSSWLNKAMYDDDVQESYEILLDSDGSIFHWRSCDPECEPWPA